jgi:hypothetical protein
MRAFLLLCLVCLLPVRAMAQVPEITGEYTVEGTAAGGNYKGQAAIAPDGDVFLVVWQIGQTRYQGTGLMKDGHLAVTYASRGRPALAFYVLRPDGSLVGTWTEFGSKSVFTETLVPKGRL